MCAINPKHHSRFVVDLYTSQELTDEQWTNLVMPRMLEIEQKLNEPGDVRAHVSISEVEVVT